MSKFSMNDHISKKLEKSLTEQDLADAGRLPDVLTEEQITALPASLFSRRAYSEEEAERTGYSDYSYWRSTIRAFFKNKAAVCMLLLAMSLVLFSVIQPYLPGQYDPNFINNDPETGMQIINQQPGGQFILGTNAIGQDFWARLWAGTRTSMFLGLTVAAIQTVIGIALGMIWGYLRSVDVFFTELYNVVTNIPSTIILILASYVLKPGIWTMVFAMCVTGWLGVAQYIRTQVMIIRDRDFNMASRCLGTPLDRIIMKNLLPHIVSVIMLRMALAIPSAIGSEVFMTYIGLGLPIETPSLGNLVNAGRGMLMSPSLRYQLIYPAIVLSVITVCFYMVGNAFGDAADPKNHL